jgi:DNA invertase Pin-like site-specific DNA recombinase
MRMKHQTRVGIYVRVSTSGQSTRSQEFELRQYAERRGWVVHKIYADEGVSGSKQSRPALDELFRDCRRRTLGGVLVWKFDRFARSLRQLVTALEEFRKLGVDFVSATEGIDTTIPSGELLFGIIASIAQFERSLISERVKSGLAQAVRQGRRLGRPPLKVLSKAELHDLRNERRTSKTSFKELAEKFGISVWTAFQMCKTAKSR